MPDVTISSIRDLGEDRLLVLGTVEGVTEPQPRLEPVLDPITSRPTGEYRPARDPRTGEYLLEPAEKWPPMPLTATVWTSALTNVIEHDHDEAGHFLEYETVDGKTPALTREPGPQGSCHCPSRKMESAEAEAFLKAELVAQNRPHVAAAAPARTSLDEVLA